MLGLHGGVVVSTIASQREGSRFNSRLGAFLCGVCMFSPCMRGFSPVLRLPYKNNHVRLIDVSKIVLRRECKRVCGCLSRLSLCGPVMDWRPVQGVPRLSPIDCWDRLQPPRDPTHGLSGYRKWMDVLMLVFWTFPSSFISFSPWAWWKALCYLSEICYVDQLTCPLRYRKGMKFALTWLRQEVSADAIKWYS